MRGYRTGGKIIFELAENIMSSLQYPPDTPVEGWVGPQKPWWGFGLFLLCRTQEPPLPEP